MKKVLRVLSLMCVALFAVTFVACSDDDEEKKEPVTPEVPDNGKFTIVGKWKLVDAETGDEEHWYFNSDGTGKFVMVEAGEIESMDITYVYNAPKLTVKWVNQGDYEQDYIVTVLSKDKIQMKGRDEEGEWTETWTRF